jgi:glutaredoxin-related protein
MRTRPASVCALLLVIKDFVGLTDWALALERNASMQGVGTKLGTVDCEILESCEALRANIKTTRSQPAGGRAHVIGELVGGVNITRVQAEAVTLTDQERD